MTSITPKKSPPADLRPKFRVSTPVTSSVFTAAFEEVFGSFRIQPIQQQEKPENKEDSE
jgi:hypothetical protein